MISPAGAESWSGPSILAFHGQPDGGDRHGSQRPVYGAWGMGGGRRTPPDTGHVDLSITRYVLEALRDARVPASDPVFEKARTFVERCQNYDADGAFSSRPPSSTPTKPDMTEIASAVMAPPRRTEFWRYSRPGDRPAILASPRGRDGLRRIIGTCEFRDLTARRISAGRRGSPFITSVRVRGPGLRSPRR